MAFAHLSASTAPLLLLIAHCSVLTLPTTRYGQLNRSVLLPLLFFLLLLLPHPTSSYLLASSDPFGVCNVYRKVIGSSSATKLTASRQSSIGSPHPTIHSLIPADWGPKFFPRSRQQLSPLSLHSLVRETKERKKERNVARLEELSPPLSISHRRGEEQGGGEKEERKKEALFGSVDRRLSIHHTLPYLTYLPHVREDATRTARLPQRTSPGWNCRIRPSTDRNR